MVRREENGSYFLFFLLDPIEVRTDATGVEMRVKCSLLYFYLYRESRTIRMSMYLLEK